jgi:hypothetical protein
MRYYLGVGRSTPVAALTGDMGWIVPAHRQWIGVIRHYCRLTCMDTNRLNYKVFVWAREQAMRGKKTGLQSVLKFLQQRGIQSLCQPEIHAVPYQDLKDRVQEILWCHYEEIWLTKVNQESAVRGSGRNKLRTYKTFKQTMKTEGYVQNILSRRARQALAKFRCGTAPLRIETGRYIGEREEERLCVFCDAGEIENEEHCLIRCKQHDAIRKTLFDSAVFINDSFMLLSDCDKFQFLMTNVEMCNITAKACQSILENRKTILYRF